MRKLSNFLWFSSLIITILYIFVSLLNIFTGAEEFINLYILLLHTLILLTLCNKYKPLYIKILITAFEVILLLKSVCNQKFDIYYLTIYLLVILQVSGIWFKYKKK